MPRGQARVWLTARGPGNWLFATPAGTVAVPIRSRIMFYAIEPVIDAGISGTGLVRVFSSHVRPAVRPGPLREVLAGFVPPSLPVQILHGDDDMVPLKVRACIDFCVPRLQAGLALMVSRPAKPWI